MLHRSYRYSLNDIDLDSTAIKCGVRFIFTSTRKTANWNTILFIEYSE